MPNITPLITHRPDSTPLYATQIKPDGFFYTTFAGMGANTTYAAGSTTIINTKDLTGANRFVFSPSKTGISVIQFAIDTNGINWNGGNNSEVNLQLFDITTGSYFGYPLYIYSGMPSGPNGILVNGVSYTTLDSTHSYSIAFQILPVGSTTDFSASATNRILFTNFS